MLPAIGGFSGRGLASLPDELAGTLRTPKVQSRIKSWPNQGRKNATYS